MAKWSTVEVPVREVPPEVPARRGGEAAPDVPAPAYGPEDFPGCESFHLSESALERYEGRLEFWDGRTETAWKVREPTSLYHERPSMALSRMAERIASLRGSPIDCFGSSDLVRRDATGRRRWLMQADEVLYLHPQRVRLPGRWIDVDTDPLPDVVLEVDHSTDVRLRKLGVYMESGFPEIWVLVPWEFSARAPGLALHVRGDDGYREAPESRAFPGWKVEEIFGALTEAPWSAGTVRAIERVALAMGAREGTKPEDDPFTRLVSAKAREEGRAKGYERGREEGDAKGYARGIAEGRGRSVRRTCVRCSRRGASRRPWTARRTGRSSARSRSSRPDGGGARVHRRGRLPPAGARAARPAGGVLALSGAPAARRARAAERFYAGRTCASNANSRSRVDSRLRGNDEIPFPSFPRKRGHGQGTCPRGRGRNIEAVRARWSRLFPSFPRKRESTQNQRVRASSLEA